MSKKIKKKIAKFHNKKLDNKKIEFNVLEDKSSKSFKKKEMLASKLKKINGTRSKKEFI